VVTADTVRLYVLGLPALLAGLWVGFKLYGKLDEATFRKLILLMLLVSGLALVAAQGWPAFKSKWIGSSALATSTEVAAGTHGLPPDATDQSNNAEDLPR
jgi:hypothetical protein